MTKWCIDHYSTVKTKIESGFIEEEEEVGQITRDVSILEMTHPSVRSRVQIDVKIAVE